MSKFVKILIKRRKKQEKYFKNYLFYAKKIKKIVKEILGEGKVLIFGSILSNDVKRDIDILIVSPKLKQQELRYKIYSKILDEIGIEHPFEFHFSTEKDFQQWYIHFIKEKIEI
ncbi:MAG: nucleotidyltransferase domain-containing protein [Candidatus Omnitrophica bacterium]|nr:nucleotidyltransferase domain-containing protein [Candidatus Omnitrophota bacterium]